MADPKIRYSVKDQFWITTWAVLWLAGWLAFRQTADGEFGMFVMFGAVLTVLAVPYAIFGAMLGRMWLGLGFGALAAVATLGCLIIFGPQIE
jgi:hypothetical protein